MKVSFYLYAEDESQVKELENALYNLVSEGYDKGNLVTAVRVNSLLRKYVNNPIISQFIYV